MSREDSLVNVLEEERRNVANSIMNFNFIKERVQLVSSAFSIKKDNQGIIYWMLRDMRVQDNWSFLFAQKLALKNKVPLYVIYFYVPTFLNASQRIYKFMFDGLREVSNECERLNIKFYLYPGPADTNLPRIVKSNNIGAVVCDFSPLRLYRLWFRNLILTLPQDIAFCQVDGHNIVPCWKASEKQECNARTFRIKIYKNLDIFLTDFPAVVAHPYVGRLNIVDNLSQEIWRQFRLIEIPNWIRPGYQAGIAMLDLFCKNRLKHYHEFRNNPVIDAVSNLSPWIHFGQISAQRCILHINKYKCEHKESVEDFYEQLIVRRELSDNFCFYNPNYDKFDFCAKWAQDTLNKHRADKRDYIYSLEDFENSRTHDPLWNAAQLELVRDGKMHGFMRMYWAKKILEWTSCPESAIEIAIYLNDHYSFDGCDPNGYVGIMWSICGTHDHGWPQRQIFGKIRYMNFEGCKRKFDIKEYMRKWGTYEEVAVATNNLPITRSKIRKKT